MKQPKSYIEENKHVLHKHYINIILNLNFKLINQETRCFIYKNS